MKVALVYDRVNKIGGAERVLEVLHEIFPEAPLYTSVYDAKKAPWAKKFHVITSFLQYVKFLPHEILPNLMPIAFISFNFLAYDIVISISSAESKYLNMKDEARHICYCLTPTRYLWSGYFNYLKNPGFGFWNGIIRKFFVVFATFMRMRDFEEAQKVDKFIAISEEVRRRIRKYYHRESEVVFPPVSFGNKKGIEGKEEIDVKVEYFLIVSRLVPYKQIDLAIHVFNDLPYKKLIIVGVGNDEQSLKKLARDNIMFYGQVSDTELSTLYNNCTALIFPGVEDFGLTSLEAQSFNKPVICNAHGGTRETIIIGKTGEMFHDERELKQIIAGFDKNKYHEEDFRSNLERFSKERFKILFNEVVKNAK